MYIMIVLESHIFGFMYIFKVFLYVNMGRGEGINQNIFFEFELLKINFLCNDLKYDRR